MNQKAVITLLSTIFTVMVILGIIFFCTLNQSILEIKNAITNSEMALFGHISSMNTHMDSMANTIQTMLDEQNSLIDGYSISYSRPSAKTLTCDVTVNVTPKTYSSDTTADLYFGEQGISMTRSGNSYSAMASVSLTEISEASVTFIQGGISQTEILPEMIGGGPQLYNGFTANPMFDCYYEDNTFYMNGEVEISFHSDFEGSIKSARFAALSDGKEIWSEKIANLIQPVNEIYSPMLIRLDKSFINVENEDDLLVYAEVVGDSGLTYRSTLWGSKETDVDGVYDADGNKIIFGEYTDY